MTRIEIHSRIGSDGVLTVRLPLGPAEANREVKVIVEAAEATDKKTQTAEEWRRFVEETAGSIADPSFIRHPQGEYEDRESWI
jgi:hypothetical protein